MRAYRNRQLTEFWYSSSYGTCFIIIINSITNEKWLYNSSLHGIHKYVYKKKKEKKIKIPSRETWTHFHEYFVRIMRRAIRETCKREKYKHKHGVEDVVGVYWTYPMYVWAPHGAAKEVKTHIYKWQGMAV